MNGTETAAVIQIFGVTVSAGTVWLILKWLVPVAIKQWHESRAQLIEKDIELEKLRKQNTDESLRATRAMVEVLNTAVNTVVGEVRSLRTSLTHTDAGLAKISSYMPMLEELKTKLEAIKAKKTAQPQGSKDFPAQEHITVGDTTIIRTKKPETAGG